MGRQCCLELLRVRTVRAERLLRPDGFGHTVRLDRTIVAAEGEVVEGLAVSAESPGQDGARRALELADPGEAEVAESLRHDPADTPQALDGQGTEESRLVAGRDNHEPVGLVQLGGHLGDELVRGQPRRCRQAGLGPDPSLDQADRVERAAEERLGPAEINEGLVDRYGFYQRRKVDEDAHDLNRNALVFPHVHRQEGGVRAEPRRAADRHRRADAEPARLIGSRGDDAAAGRAGAHDDREAAQLRAIALLDRRIERVHVHVRDRPRRRASGDECYALVDHVATASERLLGARSPCGIAGESTPGADSPARQADLGGNVDQRGDDERDVLIEIHAEFAGAAVDIIAVDRARERLVPELLPDRGRLQTADHASRPDERDGVHEAGELVAGVEGAIEARDARQAGVIRVRQDGVDDPLRDAPRQEDLGALQRMVRSARMHLVVEVVEYAGPTPRVQILVVPASVRAQGGFDGAGVFAEAVAFRELGENRPRVVASNHCRRVCWLRHLSIDFLENIQAPSSWTEGMRRSVASDASLPSSMARYVEASLRLSMSLGLTRVLPRS